MSCRHTVLRLLPVLTIAAACLAGIYYRAYSPPRYTPAQPVPFDHATHTDADKANMDCLACHRGGETQPAAGMPPASTCLDCHRHILADDPRLLPLHAAANPDSPIYTSDPLRWVRSQALPAHVHFNHAAHAKAGYACERCHPNPGSATDHSMSTCIECHRTENLGTACSDCHH